MLGGMRLHSLTVNILLCRTNEPNFKYIRRYLGFLSLKKRASFELDYVCCMLLFLLLLIKFHDKSNVQKKEFIGPKVPDDQYYIYRDNMAKAADTEKDTVSFLCHSTRKTTNQKYNESLSSQSLHPESYFPEHGHTPSASPASDTDWKSSFKCVSVWGGITQITSAVSIYNC